MTEDKTASPENVVKWLLDGFIDCEGCRGCEAKEARQKTTPSKDTKLDAFFPICPDCGHLTCRRDMQRRAKARKKS